MNKIAIFGPSGTGKTTLGRLLGEKKGQCYRNALVLGFVGITFEVREYSLNFQSGYALMVCTF